MGALRPSLAIVDVPSVGGVVVVSMREAGVRTANRIGRSSITHVALVRAPIMRGNVPHSSPSPLHSLRL